MTVYTVSRPFEDLARLVPEAVEQVYPKKRGFQCRVDYPPDGMNAVYSLWGNVQGARKMDIHQACFVQMQVIRKDDAMTQCEISLVEGDNPLLAQAMLAGIEKRLGEIPGWGMGEEKQETRALQRVTLRNQKAAQVLKELELQEVLDLCQQIGTGALFRKIAERLHIAEQTAKNYASEKVYPILGVKSKSEAVEVIKDLGLFE